MFARLSELYFNFLGKFGIGTDIAIIIILFFCLYFVIKFAVKAAIKESKYEFQAHTYVPIKNPLKEETTL